IVAGSTSDGDILGTVSGSNNLIDDATSAGGLMNGANGNLVGVAALLGSLAYNGGPTPTVALRARRPPLPAGNTALVPAAITTDQRGVPRLSAGRVDIGAVESGAIVIQVTTLTDANDDGINLPYGPGQVSLRDAITFVDADPYSSTGDGDVITFAPGLTGTLALTSGALPTITASALTIAGPGANVLTIDAQHNSRILAIAAGSTVALSGLTLDHGKESTGWGGAI